MTPGRSELASRSLGDLLGPTRRQLDPQDQALLEQLTTTRARLATLVLGQPSTLDTGQHRATIRSLEEQTEQVISNMESVLAADNASLADVIKVTVHLSDTALFARYNAVYARRFSQPYPLRTTVGSDGG